MIRKILFSLIPQGTFILSILLAFILDRYLPVARIIPPPLRLSGWVFIAGGAAVAASAMGMILLHHTTPIPGGQPSALLTRGPFSYSRNPAYLGDVLVSIGVAILLSSLSAFLAPVAVFSVIDRVVIPVEEKALHRVFGNEYEEYARNVRRWV